LYERLEANKKLWNTLTKPHVKSAFYDVEGFKAGGCFYIN
jgi:hypothetical protein